MAPTALGTFSSAAGGGTSRTFTLTTASTPGRTLFLLVKHQGTDALSSVPGISSGNLAGFDFVFSPASGSFGQVLLYRLPSESHKESISQIDFALNGTDAALTAVVVEEEDPVVNVWYDFQSGSNIVYSATSWATGSVTAARQKSVAFFIATQAAPGNLPAFDATGFDQGHVEIADTGLGSGTRIWTAVADDIDFSNERVTMTTEDSTGLDLAESLHLYFDVAPRADSYVVNRQLLRTLDEGSLSKTLSWDFTPTLNNELLVIAEAPATFTTPTGWTRVSSEYLSAYAFVAFYKTSDGTETDISWVQNGARVATAVVYEFPNGSDVANNLISNPSTLETFPTQLTSSIGPYAENRVWLAAATRGPNILPGTPAGDLSWDYVFASGTTYESSGLSVGDVSIPAGETKDASWVNPVGNDYRIFRFAVTVPGVIPPTPTVLFDLDFEDGTDGQSLVASGDLSSAGTSEYDDAQFHGGALSALFPGSAGWGYLTYDFGAGGTTEPFRLRTYIRRGTQSQSSHPFLVSIEDDTGTYIGDFQLRNENGGQYRQRWGYNANLSQHSVAAPTEVWQRVDILYEGADVATNGWTAILYTTADDTVEEARLEVPSFNTPIRYLKFGCIANAQIDYWFDDVLLRTTTVDPGPATPTTGYANPIHEENDQAGNTDHGSDVVGNGTIGYLGFARQFSVDAGENLDFSVDGVNADTIDIFRLGHYGGNFFRKLATITNTGTAQSGGAVIPDSNGGTSMSAWSTTASWSIPADTVSGMFVGVVKDSGGNPQAWIPFVVRNDSRDADIVVKMSDSTWAAAYNYFGDQGSEKSGKSVYGSGGPLGSIGDRTHAVSYDRPIVSRGPSPGDNVVNHFDNHESALIAYLEENAFDVKYISCYDLDQQDTNDVLGNAKVLISDGHDEYWSQGMWDNAVAFREAGGHLLFMSGNEVFWRVRWADNGRTMWCYKDTMPGPGGHSAGTPLDPVSWTGTWRDTRWNDRTPENLLTGTHFVMNGIVNLSATFETALFGSSPFWRSSTVETTDVTVNQVVGFEADRFVPPNAGHKLLARTRHDISGGYAGPNGENYGGVGMMEWGVVAWYASATSGMTVGFGTCQWSWGLSNRHRRGSAVANTSMRQATRNLLTDMACAAGVLPSGLVDVTPVDLSTYGASYVDPGVIPQEQTFSDARSLSFPGQAASAADAGYVLGTLFSTNRAGYLTKIRIYKESVQNWSATGDVYVQVARQTPSRGVAAEQLISVGTETGWIEVTLNTPLALQPGSMYSVGVVLTAAHQYTYAPAVLSDGRSSGDLFSPNSVFAENGSLGDVPITPSLNWYGVEPVLNVSAQGQQGQDGSIWYDRLLPGVTSASDGFDLALVTRFTLSAPGTIQRLYYYKHWVGNQSPVTMYLADFSNEIILNQVVVDWGTETGWVYADLPGAVEVGPGLSYGVGILMPSSDNFSVEVGVFDNGPIVSGSITAIEGRYLYTSTIPTTGMSLAASGRSYYLDVQFVAESSEPTYILGNGDSGDTNEVLTLPQLENGDAVVLFVGHKPHDSVVSSPGYTEQARIANGAVNPGYNTGAVVASAITSLASQQTPSLEFTIAPSPYISQDVVLRAVDEGVWSFDATTGIDPNSGNTSFGTYGDSVIDVQADDFVFVWAVNRASEALELDEASLLFDIPGCTFDTADWAVVENRLFLANQLSVNLHVFKCLSGSATDVPLYTIDSLASPARTNGSFVFLRARFTPGPFPTSNFKLGGQDVVSIYIGGQQVTRFYKGSAELWQNN